jgi:hypothetical protein
VEWVRVEKRKRRGGPFRAVGGESEKMRGQVGKGEHEEDSRIERLQCSRRG